MRVHYLMFHCFTWCQWVILEVEKPIRHVRAGALGRVKPIPLAIATVQSVHTHCTHAHDMSIRPIRVEVTNVFWSDQSRKLKMSKRLIRGPGVMSVSYIKAKVYKV